MQFWSTLIGGTKTDIYVGKPDKIYNGIVDEQTNHALISLLSGNPFPNTLYIIPNVEPPSPDPEPNEILVVEINYGYVHPLATFI